MPFGLKNDEATYQRLMDKIFEKIIGTDVEVYMDDMVVKSIVAGDHCKALERVFQLMTPVSVTVVQEREGVPHSRLNRLPIKHVLRKPDLADKMVAWSIHLFEFDISYESRGHIKAQVLADFITDMKTGGPTAEEDKGWFLSVDGASNQIGSEAGVILEEPNGVLIEQSLYFEFRANNNQVEYETLLFGMRPAKELEVKTVTAKRVEAHHGPGE
ncbi:hypothetical protein CR513_54168, partial [Mucuna pruriens]